MHFKKVSVEFEVTSLDEVRLLLQTWHQVLARFQEGNAIHQRLTEHHLVNIKLDDRVTPEEVLVLQFIAKPEMLDQLIGELKTTGWSCPSKSLIPWMVTRYRLGEKGH
jgi:hypothetical protein